MPRLTFKKEERLTNKKTFDLLFNSGKSFTVFPFRIVWIESALAAAPLSPRRRQPAGWERSSGGEVQLGISVPKRSFAKAVDRNTLKRRIRESYRKNKHVLYEILKDKNRSIALMIIYTAKEELPYQEIEKKMILSLVRITNEIRICE